VQLRTDLKLTTLNKVRPYPRHTGNKECPDLPSIFSVAEPV
jgi:hypothetical protein